MSPPALWCQWNTEMTWAIFFLGTLLGGTVLLVWGKHSDPNFLVQKSHVISPIPHFLGSSLFSVSIPRADCDKSNGCYV